MRMACKSPKKLKKLVNACADDALFDKKLKTSVFECVIEIVKNASKGRMADECFFPKTRKKMKKSKKLLNFLKNSKISLKKRKKKFLKLGKNERKLFNSYIIADFMKNCLHHE